MSTRVGVGVYGTTSATITLVAGKSGILHGKFEGGTGVVTPASFTDPLGNTWTRQSVVYHATGGEPGSVIYTCLGIVTGGSVTLAIPYTGTTATFLRHEVEQWDPGAGNVHAVDGVFSAQATGGGGTGTYNAITGASATGAGVAIFAVSDFASLGTLTGGGTPGFAITVAVTANGDSFMAYAAVTGAGAVTPSVSTTSGFTRSVQHLILLKEVAAGGSSAPAAYHLMQMQG